MQVHAVSTDIVSNIEAAQHEYLRPQVKPGHNYGIDLALEDATAGSVARSSAVVAGIPFELYFVGHAARK